MRHITGTVLDKENSLAHIKPGGHWWDVMTFERTVIWRWEADWALLVSAAIFFKAGYPFSVACTV